MVIKRVKQISKFYNTDFKYLSGVENRFLNNKKSEKSPDFVCSTNDPAICGGHTGKWRKSWWLDNSDIPDEWGMNDEKTAL